MTHCGNDKFIISLHINCYTLRKKSAHSMLLLHRLSSNYHQKLNWCWQCYLEVTNKTKKHGLMTVHWRHYIWLHDSMCSVWWYNLVALINTNEASSMQTKYHLIVMIQLLISMKSMTVKWIYSWRFVACVCAAVHGRFSEIFLYFFFEG